MRRPVFWAAFVKSGASLFLGFTCLLAGGGPLLAAEEEAITPEEVAPSDEGEEGPLARVFGSEQEQKDFPVTTRIFPLLAADGSAYVSFVAGVRTSDLPLAAGEGSEPAAHLRIRNETIPDGIVEITDESLFRIRRDPAGDWVLIATAISLPPDRYTFYCALEDPASGKIGTSKETVTLPDYATGGLTLGPVILATHVEAVEEAPSASKTEKALPSPFEVIEGGAATEPEEDQEMDAFDPFRFGQQRLTPRLDETLASGNDLAFFYVVYGASPQGGPARMDVVYTFEKSTSSGWRPVGRPVELPGQSGASQGFTIPADVLERWPGGSYRVGISVKEAGTGGQAGASLEFTLKR
jgi:hypothetical protein